MDIRVFLGVYSNEIFFDKVEILGFENFYGSYIIKVIGNMVVEIGGLEFFDFIYGIDDFRVSWYEDFFDMLSVY